MKRIFLLAILFSSGAANAQGWDHFVTFSDSDTVTFVNAATTTQGSQIIALENEAVVYWFGPAGIDDLCAGEGMKLAPFEVRQVSTPCQGTIVVVHQSNRKLIVEE